ncbi:uncharacterized protein [Epargyreus clarus]|uniref:uncharacterized protein isoform X2 n=1 Tax=Epargyreus clarus TaxID=520877 RepID=UPI003C2C7BF2
MHVFNANFQVRRRLETTLKRRKSSRLSIFDSIRNLPSCDSPKKPNPQSKVEHRRMQLEKWKEEKEKRKQQAAAQKKKPFVAGVPHPSLKFEPPPPPPKAVPSTSGRVTRSQSAKNNAPKAKPTKNTTQTLPNTKTESFAPKNAAFKPPEIKNMTKVPVLTLATKNKKTKESFTFKPILPEVPKVNSKATKTKPLPKKVETNTVSNKASKSVGTRSTRGRFVKIQSSSSDQTQSSSDMLSPVPEIPSKTKSPRKSAQSKMVTPRKPIPKSESSSEERLRSPKSPVDMPMTPEQIVEEAKKCSPCVTMSRGKDNARREMKKKIDEGLLDEDVSDVDSVDHFRRQHSSEIKRMTEMCETWEKISEQMVLPEAVQDAILSAVGQARLLMSQKMQQFATLVARRERPEPGHALVTPADLHGFWDMVFMQVENVDMRFKKLEEMRTRNWVEEAPVVQRKKVAPRPKVAVKPAATSRIKDMIAAARKAKKQDAAPQEGPANPSAEPSAEAPETNKTFEAGFFCVRSPVRAPAAPASPARSPATPAGKHSLLKAVLSSEAKKSASKNSASSLAMLRASLIGKNVENDSSALTEQLVRLTPINLYATPGRSILKPLSMPSATKSGKKSIKVVLFDDSDADAQDTSVNDTDVHGVSGVKNIEDANTDSGVSSMDIEKEKEQKENKSSRKKSLVRQDATEENSPVMTRSRRKSMPNPALDTSLENAMEKTPKRTSRRKKTLQEVETNIIEDKKTSKRSSRRKSAIQGVA